jgi:signal peptidase I
VDADAAEASSATSPAPTGLAGPMTQAARPAGSPGPSLPPSPARARGAEADRRWRWVVEWAVVLVIALAVALCVRAFVIQTFFIPSASMEPTLMIGDRILVDKLSYHLHAVHRGDIIVFNRPPGEPKSQNIQDLVKRVVGLPGETIWSSDGNVYVQGPDTHNKVVLVPEPVPGTALGLPIPRTVIPAGDYYVLGDNRTNSDDSRYFGFVPRSDIVGRVVMRIWPLSAIRFF